MSEVLMDRRAFLTTAGRSLIVSRAVVRSASAADVREMQSLEGLHQQFNSHGLIVLGIDIYDRADLQGIADWLGSTDVI